MRAISAGDPVREIATAAPVRVDAGVPYMLNFSVPMDTPGCYVRALFAMYGLPRAAADAFFADVSSAIRSGREDLLVSEERLVHNALGQAFSSHPGAIAMKPFVESELLGLLASGRRAA